MSSCTDPLHLNETRLFKELRESFSSNTKETRNILEIWDDVLYVWNAEKCCLQTLNVGATRGKFDEYVPYQTLQPTDPPIFEVTNVCINETATQVALWGNLGIAVMELPKRWNKDTSFHKEKDTTICAYTNVMGRTWDPSYKDPTEIEDGFPKPMPTMETGRNVEN